MPELPDINLYVEKIDERVRGQVLNDIRVSKPFRSKTTLLHLHLLKN